jgi:16S rRNA (guanine527-N7)-methyltransferase
VITSVLKYFPNLTGDQIEKFSLLNELYSEWNDKINVISRKDIENFYIHHVLHSLAISLKYNLGNGLSVLDVGTGGGFPGIPLAILFPHSEFTLLDSIEKKLKVVNAITNELDLRNVKTVRSRIEDHRDKYNYIVSRAVTDFNIFVKWAAKNIVQESAGLPENGIIYLKGGDIVEELAGFMNSAVVTDIKDYFSEPYFETKRIVYLPSSFFQKKTVKGS